MKGRINLVELRDLTAEMNRFVTAMGWYQEDTPRHQTPRNLAISLSLEAAEVLEHFQWNEEITDRHEFEGELADVALYLLQLASVSNIDLEKAILTKLQTNYSRQWDQNKGNKEDKQ